MIYYIYDHICSFQGDVQNLMSTRIELLIKAMLPGGAIFRGITGSE